MTTTKSRNVKWQISMVPITFPSSFDIQTIHTAHRLSQLLCHGFPFFQILSQLSWFCPNHYRWTNYDWADNMGCIIWWAIREFQHVSAFNNSEQFVICVSLCVRYWLLKWTIVKHCQLTILIIDVIICNIVNCWIAKE